MISSDTIRKNLLVTAASLVLLQITSCATSVVEKSDSPVYEPAKEITVLIDALNPGSGFIVGSRDNTHYILTAHHVVKSPDEYDIITPDGETHRLEPENYDKQVTKLPDLDLAIITFESENTYAVPELRTDGVTEATVVHVAGFPGKGSNASKLQVSDGLIVSNDLAVEPFEDGYGMIYNSDTLPGMSGGPVFDEQGRIVGIHGRAEQELSGSEWEKTGFNLGIPIWPFRELVLSSLDLRLATKNRTAMADDFTSNLFTALTEACPSDEIRYRSLNLFSPDGNISSFMEGSLSSSGDCNGYKSSLITDSVDIVLENKDGTSIRKDYIKLLNRFAEPGKGTRSKESIDSVAVIANPLAFSPDGKYLLVDERGLRAYSETGTGHAVIDLENSKAKPIFLCPVELEDELGISYMFPVEFRGFRANREAVMLCAEGISADRLFEVVVNIENEKPVDVKELFSYEDAQELPTYGSISSLPEILTE